MLSMLSEVKSTIFAILDSPYGFIVFIFSVIIAFIITFVDFGGSGDD